jgi:hypothetical protein
MVNYSNLSEKEIEALAKSEWQKLHHNWSGGEYNCWEYWLQAFRTVQKLIYDRAGQTR